MVIYKLQNYNLLFNNISDSKIFKKEEDVWEIKKEIGQKRISFEKMI